MEDVNVVDPFVEALVLPSEPVDSAAPALSLHWLSWVPSYQRRAWV